MGGRGNNLREVTQGSMKMRRLDYHKQSKTRRKKSPKRGDTRLDEVRRLDNATNTSCDNIAKHTLLTKSRDPPHAGEHALPRANIIV